MFTNDSRTENFLTQLGVSWKYTNNIKFSHLKRGWQENNLARPVPIRDDAVEEYAALTASGSPAPGPILIETAAGFDVLDGVQRLAAAALCDITTISGYVVTCDSLELVAAIRILSNARLQGRAEPMEWTRRKAVEELVVSRGMSVAEVAKLGGWRQKDVELIAEAIEWRATVAAIGGPDNLSDSMLHEISSRITKAEMRASPHPISKFLNSLKRTKLSASDASLFLDDFFAPVSKQSKSAEVYAKRLKEFESCPEVETRIKGRKGCSLPPDVNLRRTLRAAIGILDEIDVNELKYIDEFFGLVNELREKLHKLSSHKKPITARVPADLYK